MLWAVAMTGVFAIWQIGHWSVSCVSLEAAQCVMCQAGASKAPTTNSKPRKNAMLRFILLKLNLLFFLAEVKLEIPKIGKL